MKVDKAKVVIETHIWKNKLYIFIVGPIYPYNPVPFIDFRLIAYPLWKECFVNSIHNVHITFSNIYTN